MAWKVKLCRFDPASSTASTGAAETTIIPLGSLEDVQRTINRFFPNTYWSSPSNQAAHGTSLSLNASIDFSVHLGNNAIYNLRFYRKQHDVDRTNLCVITSCSHAIRLH